MQENTRDEFLKIAEEYVLNNAGDHVEVSYTEDYDDLFVFGYQAKDKKVCLIGQGPILLVKKDGRIFEFGSATGHKQALLEVIKKLNKERLIRIFQEDYNIQNNNYDLIINDIHKDEEYEDYKELDELTTVLLRNKINYLVRNENNEVKCHYYTKEQLEEALKQTPANLGHNFDEYLEDVLIDLINTNIYFRWTLSEIK
ncbi:hypothetical protein PGH12_07365 [Chryseobacterium wangxinyae]|uniref:hypothetical protein n=1 Tax=Chryseobacterium sp. CY350 TaxID=2997336 RepID=UPI0022713719|nr:hypothetical protein [Chryseobacterium sp. CY350]MCY0976967.1 hypothetical protein [Chryseobacterium sp. CY350]WBZ96967.1 hypothetical protein PGH12_07365 [Chryseobacterium sp. CY350]